MRRTKKRSSTIAGPLTSSRVWPKGRKAQKDDQADAFAAVKRIVMISKVLSRAAELMEETPDIDPQAAALLRQLQIRMRVAAAALPCEPRVPLPDKAPALFQEREEKSTPIEFFRRNYKSYL